MSGKDAEPVGYRVADIYIDVGTRQVSRGDNLEIAGSGQGTRPGAGRRILRRELLLCG